MVARDATKSLVLISFQFCPRSSLAVPRLQSAMTGAAQPGKNPGNVSIITISDIGERYFEFYKRLPQRKTPFVMGGE
ncbi:MULTISPECIES: hypothetical protein [Bradyrhizobium]|jgi:hypothetical protein|uniref:hypothetical protein n=1 Tax=Bradyrhizobium TaxID=374 RepID=UPI00293F4A6F|nr:hypothetical protein [Bradyrhizobium sp. NDS-1]WOH75083.1 hypothetical protein RX330_08145 [Bradyrhizobium sp. NDS-1]